MPALAEHYRVFAPERRGRARTPDVEGPMTWDAMADDTAAFLESLGTGPVNLVGWSDGATARRSASTLRSAAPTSSASWS